MTNPLSHNPVRTVGLILAGAPLGGIGFAASKLKKADPVEVQQAQAPSIPVRVRTAQNSHESIETVIYPGSIASENEAVVIAKANGTATNLKFKVG